MFVCLRVTNYKYFLVSLMFHGTDQVILNYIYVIDLKEFDAIIPYLKYDVLSYIAKVLIYFAFGTDCNGQQSNLREESIIDVLVFHTICLYHIYRYIVAAVYIKRCWTFMFRKVGNVLTESVTVWLICPQQLQQIQFCYCEILILPIHKN